MLGPVELDPSTVSAVERTTGPGDDRARRLAAAEGLVLHQDASVPAHTAEAHQVLHLARERGAQPAVDRRSLAARRRGGGRRALPGAEGTVSPR